MLSTRLQMSLTLFIFALALVLASGLTAALELERRECATLGNGPVRTHYTHLRGCYADVYPGITARVGGRWRLWRMVRP